MLEDSWKLAKNIGVYIAPGGHASIGAINGQKQLTPTKSILCGSVHFVGRETELTTVHENLQRGDYVAIAGMGGVGKTELATQYVRRYEQDYGGIAWFNDRETNLAAEVLKFFRQLGLEIPQELGGILLSLKEQVAWCWSRYPNFELPILIVFDDVTNLDNLRQVVPEDNRFRVLITTRLRHLDPIFIKEIPLDVLSPQKEPGKALELLKRLLGEKDKRVENQPQTATSICEYLEYLPLGIELVGGYLVRDPEISLDIMFGRLQECKLAESALQDRETLKSTQLGVKAAFALTWEELDPLAQQLGRFLSLFSPVQILWDLVIWVATGGEEAENQEERQLIGPEDKLNAAKNQLYGRNLLQRVEEREGYYKIHALVRWFLQEELANFGETKSVLETTFATAMIAKAQILPDSPTSKDIEFFKDVIIHLEDIGKRLIADIKEATEAQTFFTASVPNDQVLWIFMGIGRFYEGQGLYKLAEPWRKDCVNVCQALFAGDHLEVASSLNNLALLYDKQGRYSEAEPLLTQALEMTKRLFKGDHPNVATGLHNLAFLYQNQVQYSKAELLYDEALKMRKRLFKGDHPNTANTLHNLAFLYTRQGQYKKAELLCNEALRMTTQLSNEDDCWDGDIANCLCSLGRLYTDQGQYSQAESLLNKVLGMRKRLFNGDHPDTADTLSFLGSVYTHQGQYNKAESVLNEALKMRERLLLFNDDWNITHSLHSLGLLYQSQGDYSKAESFLNQALEMKKRLFNGDHPHTANNLAALGSVYTDQGQYNKAESVLNEALKMRERLFKGDHADVAHSLNTLGFLYDIQKQYSKTEPLYNKTLEMRKRLFKDDHPDMVNSLSNLAAVYNNQGRYSEAELLITQALEMSKRLFGINHSTTVKCQENLAIVQDQSTPGYLERLVNWLSKFI